MFCAICVFYTICVWYNFVYHTRTVVSYMAIRVWCVPYAYGINTHMVQNSYIGEVRTLIQIWLKYMKEGIDKQVYVAVVATSAVVS